MMYGNWHIIVFYGMLGILDGIGGGRERGITGDDN